MKEVVDFYSTFLFLFSIEIAKQNSFWGPDGTAQGTVR
jgi:hypothetical protein